MLKKLKADSDNNLSAIDEGIEITPIPVTLGDRVTIKYDGLLADSGADKIYAHIGYGDNDNWTGIQDIPMKKTKNGWVCDTFADEERLNFCFRDSANNWDNNNGRNWSLTVHNGRQLN